VSASTNVFVAAVCDSRREEGKECTICHLQLRAN